MMPPIKSLAVLLVSALVGSPTYAHHTTDHTMQQLEYERQQREHWRQQEQRREEERRQQQIWQDNARRQQEESNRARASTPKSSDGPMSGATSGSGPARASGGDAAAMCKAHPVRAGERNPLIGGQWRPVNAPTGDAFTQLFQMATLGVCAVFQAGIEFRERTFVNVIGEFPIRYGHKGDIWFACFPDTTFAFRVDNTNQISVAGVDPPCRLRREGAAQVAEVASARSGAATAGAAVSSGAAGGGAAVLAFVATAAAPSGASVPAAGSSFFMLRNSVESVMAQAGIQPTNGSRLKAWSVACDSGAPACRQGMNALIQASVAVAKTDGSGRARMQPVQPGTYYLFGTTPPATSPLTWDVKVHLKPGDNLHMFDRSNAAPLN